MTVDASIRVESVVVEHATPGGPVFALDGVSFAVDAGSSVAVTGPSGCGKSTLLGVLGGLAAPSSGVVRIVGEEQLLEARHRTVDFQIRNMASLLETATETRGVLDRAAAALS